MVARLFSFRAYLWQGGTTGTPVPTGSYPTVSIVDSAGGIVRRSNNPADLLNITIESTIAYSVNIESDGAGYSFVQWANGSTTRSRPITATSEPAPADLSFNAYFSTAQTPNSSTLTVVGVDEATGEAVDGMNVYVVPTPPNGIASVFTPGTFTLQNGVEYQLYANNYVSPEGNTTLFTRWGGQPIGAGSNPLTVNISSNQSRTAYYDVTIITPPPPPPPPPPSPTPTPTPGGVTGMQVAIGLGLLAVGAALGRGKR